MRQRYLGVLVTAGIVTASLVMLAASAEAQQANGEMSFFVTSRGNGTGAGFGGLAGADAFCQSLAAAAGAGGRTWHAYLSTQAVDGSPAVNARDRIGAGPWKNAKGVVIAASVDALHANNNLNKETALTEHGDQVNGRTDKPNTHDILTGSLPNGMAFPPGEDMTCQNWTSNAGGAAMVGHHDRQGLTDDPPAKSWNSSHASRGGCGLEALHSTGGAGLLYCFAIN
jgi:hypothetical protein